MKLHFEGKYDGNPEHLKNQRYVNGSIKFREPSLRVFALIANVLSVVLLVITATFAIWRGGSASFSVIGLIAAIASLVPHEYIHAVVFKNDVYMYTDIKHGLLFVVGSESMSRSRFICMSLLPNIVFGILPYAVFVIWPRLKILGTMGAFCIAFGAGDYINVFNALTQMPRNAVTYLYRQNSYWYIPEDR